MVEYEYSRLCFKADEMTMTKITSQIICLFSTLLYR